ncbi:phosphodiester glycosidase family protein [Anaerolinea sp.]|uniref:phosphodiester glycosidase family protein n=1 Tax=Anaerolinea sp. TaxID=1872519 RepID=UPI002ACD50E5|nr:phosphodiester glycosidase family protein [Anaerolinea sp.]
MHYKRILLSSLILGLIVIASSAVSASSTSSKVPPSSIPGPVLPDALDVSSASCTSLANWQCVETRPGLSLCRANNICIVKVDLNNNTLRPRVVIAPGGGTDWLSNMASNTGALAAINGDYFSGCPDTTSPLNCGEGLTFVDGTDYTDYTGSEWQNRRSLGFNDNYDPNIGWPSEQGSYHRYLLGGGPQVTFNGEYRWRCWYQSSNTEGDCACQNNSVVINDELFGCSANNWWSRPQTFVGFSDDRNTLYLAVSEPGYNKTPHQVHDALWVLGSRYSIKMDGGGSSGMYFNDGSYSFAWNGSRPVANAWVILPYSAPPPTVPPPSSCDANSLPSGYVKCADENGYCAFSGMQQVYYGAGSCYKVKQFTNGVMCNNSNFGDPLPGVSKACYIPPSCNPTANQAALYANTNFSGACITLNVGDYSNPGYLGSVGNDNAESIRVGGNVQAILCEHDNYQGQCETFFTEDANLGDNLIGSNRVSSVRVLNRPVPTSTPVPIPTPIDETVRIFIPIVQKSEFSLLNGSFENGPVGWTEYSSHGWPLILSSSSLIVTPHNGNWSVWLGGDDDEISDISQQVRVPTSQPYLTYWQWITSSETGCNWDYGKVMVNGVIVDEYGLCSSTNTGGWASHSVNLSAYVGQLVTVHIRVETDPSINSNLFIDDVAFGSVPLLSTIQGNSMSDESEFRPKVP